MLIRQRERTPHETKRNKNAWDDHRNYLGTHFHENKKELGQRPKVPGGQQSYVSTEWGDSHVCVVGGQTTIPALNWDNALLIIIVRLGTVRPTQSENLSRTQPGHTYRIPVPDTGNIRVKDTRYFVPGTTESIVFR